jgi:hypothetical protein
MSPKHAKIVLSLLHRNKEENDSVARDTANAIVGEKDERKKIYFEIRNEMAKEQKIAYEKAIDIINENIKK